MIDPFILTTGLFWASTGWLCLEIDGHRRRADRAERAKKAEVNALERALTESHRNSLDLGKELFRYQQKEMATAERCARAGRLGGHATQQANAKHRKLVKQATIEAMNDIELRPRDEVVAGARERIEARRANA